MKDVDALIFGSLQIITMKHFANYVTILHNSPRTDILSVASLRRQFHKTTNP